MTRVHDGLVSLQARVSTRNEIRSESPRFFENKGHKLPLPLSITQFGAKMERVLLDTQLIDGRAVSSVTVIQTLSATHWPRCPQFVRTLDSVIIHLKLAT